MSSTVSNKYFGDRYADIMVHRLLAVCILADQVSPELLDKNFSHTVCKNLNYRNRMAQYAGRASVALHTHVSMTATKVSVELFSHMYT